MGVPFLAIDPKLIELIVLIIAFLGMIGSIVNKIKTLGKPPPNRNLARPVRPNRPGRPEGGTVQEQIEEFLRRAQQRQVSKPAAPARPARPAPPPVEAEVLDDAPVGGRVGQQVRQYLDSSEFSRRTAQLGGEVVQSDQQFTDLVQQAFSGEVSTLSTRPGEAAQAPQIDEIEMLDDAKAADALSVPGEGLGAMFADPQTLVQAIIMNEILPRRQWN